MGSALEIVGAGLVVAGCFVVALWLGLIVSGVLLIVGAQAVKDGNA